MLGTDITAVAEGAGLGWARLWQALPREKATPAEFLPAAQLLLSKRKPSILCYAGDQPMYTHTHTHTNLAPPNRQGALEPQACQAHPHPPSCQQASFREGSHSGSCS